jgi:hypothetical protein
MKKKPRQPKNDIKILKMTYGESIICRVRRDGDFYVITSPMQMVHMPVFGKDGNVSGSEICFRDWIEGSIEDEFRIPATSVLVETFPERSIRVLYEKMMKQDRMPFTEEDLRASSDFIDKVSDIIRGVSGGLSGPPPQERINDEDDDLDGGWRDVPPRFRM